MRRAGTFVVILVAALAATTGQADTSVEGVRLGSSPDRTRVVLDLTLPAPYTLFRLSNPERVVVDIEDAEFSAQEDTSFYGTPITGLRTGKRASGVLRIVLDLTASGFAVRDFTLPPDRDAGRGHRLVLDLIPPSTSVAQAGSAAAVEAAGPLPESAGEAQGRKGAIVSGDLASDDVEPASREDTEIASADTVRDAGAGDPGDSEPIAERAPASAARNNTVTTSPRIDFSGTWQHEWAWATENGDSQKFESILQPRWDVGFASGANLTAILRLRADGVGDLGPTDRRPPNYSDASAPWFNSGEASLSLRELFVDFQWGQTDWRLGKQQVVWGQADGIKVLDVVNPQSFREFILDDFDDSRIPLWSANVNVPLGDAANLQLLWVPDTTYHELAETGTPFAFTTPRIVPQVPITALAEVDKPDDPLADSDVGIALSGFLGGWDLSLNYLYRYLDIPALPVRVRGPTLLRLEPEYERSHLLGGSFSNAFGSMTLRGEVAYNSDTFQPTNTLIDEAVATSDELSSVIGLDWAPSMNTLVSAQWFNSYLFDHTDPMGRDQHEQLLTLLYQQDLVNATWRVRGIGIHSVNDGDTQLQLRLSYWLTGAVQVWLGADLFDGDERGLFGQFDNNDRALVGFELGF